MSEDTGENENAEVEPWWCGHSKTTILRGFMNEPVAEQCDICGKFL